jgi:hypothetical protein
MLKIRELFLIELAYKDVIFSGDFESSCITPMYSRSTLKISFFRILHFLYTYSANRFSKNVCFCTKTPNRICNYSGSLLNCIRKIGKSK